RRRTLEAITHPRIRERFQRQLDALTARGFRGLVFFDAAVMIESGNYRNMDRLVVVVADEPTQIARLMARDGIDSEEALRKIRSQMPLAEKAKFADHVIDNSGELAARLRPRFPGAEVVETDARTWDYGALERPPGGRVLVVGNLPYSVGKPILMALVAARTAIDAMALMLQREVADRVAAAPGSRTYGSMSILTQLYCD